MNQLDHILSHTDCLTQEQLMQYAQQNLPQEATHDIEAHLIDCDFCSDALEGLQMLSADESQENLLAIQTAIEAQLDLAKPTEEYSVEHSQHDQGDEKVVPLKSTKGGKRISWAAVAGIFFLVFGGGLVVFSYINNNTTWFANNPSYSKNGKSQNKEILKEPSVKSSPEYGNMEINADPIENAEQIKESELEKKGVSKKEDIRKEKIVKDKEEIVANRVQETDTKNLKRDLPSPTVAQNSSPKPNKKTKEIIAQNNNELEKDFGNISTQNTYSQDRYDGKMKNQSEIGNEQSSSTNKRAIAQTKENKNEAASISGGRADETVYAADAGKKQTQKKKKYTPKDKLSQANESFATGDYKQSIKNYKKVLRQQSVANREEVLYKLALAYENTGDYTKAQKIYEELSKYEKTKARAQNGLNRLQKAKSKK